MNSVFLQQAALDSLRNQWVAILPEVMLGVIALALLVLELALPKKHHDLIPGVSIAAQLGLAAALLVNFRVGVDSETFNGSFTTRCGASSCGSSSSRHRSS